MSNTNYLRLLETRRTLPDSLEEGLAPGQCLQQSKSDIAKRSTTANRNVGGISWEWLPSTARDRWLQTIEGLTFPNYDLPGWSVFRTQAREAAAAVLPDDVVKLLSEFARPGGHDAITIDNLPIDADLGVTPPDGQRPLYKKAVSEAVITGIVERMGCEVFSYKQEKGGELFHQLVPVAGEEEKQSNTGRAKFGYHTDNANIPTRFRQECLGLFGLRNEKDVCTLIITLDELKQAIPDALWRELRYPIYQFPAPLSFDLAGWSVLSECRPVIWTDDSGIDRIALPRSDFVQPDTESEAAIIELRALLDTIQPWRIVISPGRFLAFHDNRVLHGRDKVMGDRWLQRVYFSHTLKSLRVATHSAPGEFSFDARLLMMAA